SSHRTKRQRKSPDSQALANPLIERLLVIASWCLSIGFTSRTSGEAIYSIIHRAGLVCTMMNVFEWRAGTGLCCPITSK
ncbi:hypothetical protein N9L74_05130, partial [Luminiphilus sp.]|nr:hypothetical protein [Luminiphilus sp.]